MNSCIRAIALAFFPLSVLAQTPGDTIKRSLDEVIITSKYYRNYKPDQSSGSLKVTTPLLHLSQNIQVIDRSILSDQQVINVNESLTRNVSGALRNNTADFYGPSIYMRGAAINTLRNGVDVSMIYYGPMPEDAAIIDRLEFVKGPAGFMNSIGDPAGSFNIVTKQPTGIQSNQVTASVGSFDLYRLTGDFDGSVDAQKKWQYRVVVAGQKANSFQKFAFNDKWLVKPVLRYQINATSSLTAEYSYQHQRYLQYLLTVFSPYGFGSLPHEFSIADPSKKPVSAQENNAFLTYANQLNSRWQLTLKAAYLKSHLDGNYFFVSAYDKNQPSQIRRRVTYEQFNTSVVSFQGYLNGVVHTGALTHQLLVGVDANQKYLLAYSGFNDTKANPTLYPLDVNQPVYGITFDSNEKQGNLRDFATNEQTITYGALYAQDEFRWLNDKLRVTLAARITHASVGIDRPVAAQIRVKNTVVTPRFGLSYALMNDFSVYALLDNTFTPQSGLPVSGGTFKPLYGTNYEAGVKKDWMHGKWNTTASVFHITRDNVIVSDPVTNLQSQIGQTVSKGIEFDVKGELVKGLNAVINYAYLDSYVSKDANEAYVGRPTPYRVKHNQNTWLNYRLPWKSLAGITVSTGYQWQVGRAGRYYQDVIPPIANVFRLDAGIGWANTRYSVQMLVNNVTNRFNYGSAWTRPTGLYAYVPLTPREVRVSAGITF